MKLLQIAFIAVLGSVCFATYVTSETLHQTREIPEREMVIPAPDSL